MSYRLDQRDEADVRYWLGDDLRGDVGVKSGSSSLDVRSVYKPIENFKPFRYAEKDDNGDWVFHGTEDVGLRCGPIVVKTKKPPYVHHIASQTLIRVSEHDQLLEGIWDRLHQKCNDPDRTRAPRFCYCKTLDICYAGSPVPHGFGIFGDIAPLLYDTRGAHLCEQRESSHAKRRLTRLEALMQFGTRLERHGEDTSESDKDLRAEMEEDADRRLSKACREYTHVADVAYAARMEQETAVAA